MPNRTRGPGRVGGPWRRAQGILRARYPEGPCWLCGNRIDPDAPPRTPGAWSADHVVPVSKGGDPLAQENLRPAHHGCNSRRGNGTRTPRPSPGPLRTSRAW